MLMSMRIHVYFNVCMWACMYVCDPNARVHVDSIMYLVLGLESHDYPQAVSVSRIALHSDALYGFDSWIRS